MAVRRRSLMAEVAHNAGLRGRQLGQVARLEQAAEEFISALDAVESPDYRVGSAFRYLSETQVRAIVGGVKSRLGV